MKDLSSTEILKTKINVTNMRETAGYLEENLESLRGQYVCVSNVHTTVMAYRDQEYRRVQNGSVLNLPDGKPLSIVQKRLGYAEAERVAGPDLMEEMFARSENGGYRHYFYGSSPETIRELKQKLAV